MLLKKIDIGFANLSIELMDDMTPETTQVVVGLTDKKTKDYIQDLCLVQKAESKGAVNVYVYADENSEDYTHMFETDINKLLKGEENSSKSKRIFISGPISGLDDYMGRFAEAEEKLREDGYLPINPTVFSKHLLNGEFNWFEFMDITMALLKQCDNIYMLEGWKNSRGACIELEYAAQHQYTVVMQQSEGQKNE